MNLPHWLMAAVVLAFGGIRSLAQSSPAPLVIRNATVVDLTGNTRSHRANIVVEGPRITTVSPNTVESTSTQGRQIDASGKYVIPGLWDMHFHLFASKASALPLLVANGVTGIRDLGGLLRETDEWRVAIDQGIRVGPRILRCGPMLNGRQFGIQQIAVMNESEARGAVRALQRSGVDFIKVHRAISREAYFSALDECRKLGLPLVGHVPNTVTPQEASAAGQACIEHMGTLFEGTFAVEHRDEPFPTALERFAKVTAPTLFAHFASNHTAFVPTLVSHQRVIQFGREKPDPRDKYVSKSARKFLTDLVNRDKAELTDAFYERMEQQFQAALPLVKELQTAGVRILAGTDDGFGGTYPGFNLHTELELMVRAGLQPWQALRTATRNPAEFLRLEDTGDVAAGHRADFVILDADPLEDIRNTRKIHAVVLAGRFFDRADLDELLNTAAQLAQSE